MHSLWVVEGPTLTLTCLVHGAPQVISPSLTASVFVDGYGSQADFSICVTPQTQGSECLPRHCPHSYPPGGPAPPPVSVSTEAHSLSPLSTPCTTSHQHILNLTASQRKFFFLG